MDAPLSEFNPAVELLGEATRWAVTFASQLGQRRAASKADASPVTAADLALQALLVAGLQDRYGHVSVVGEESTAIFRGEGGGQLRDLVHGLARSARPAFTADAIDASIDAGGQDGTSREQWIIDPIDGTRGYLGGQQYCVCLAFVRDGEVLFGGAGCPRLAEGGLFVAAARSRGAWVWRGLEPKGEPERAMAVGRARPELVACESPDASERARQRLRLLTAGAAGRFTTRPIESQCKFVAVAAGQADVAVRFPARNPLEDRDSVWDYAGAVVMAEEAGGKMTDCDGKPLRFGRGRYIEGNRGVLCAAPWFHGTAVARMPEVDRQIDAARSQARSDG